MILMCDEDVGAKVPGALRLVGLHTISLANNAWKGMTDLEWLRKAGEEGWLAFSCNRAMLEVPAEREAIISSNVGIVFLTSGHEHPKDTLRLLLNKWQWLELLDTTVARPFAYYVYPSGRVRNIPIT